MDLEIITAIRDESRDTMVQVVELDIAHGNLSLSSIETLSRTTKTLAVFITKIFPYLGTEEGNDCMIMSFVIPAFSSIDRGFEFIKDWNFKVSRGDFPASELELKVHEGCTSALTTVIQQLRMLRNKAIEILIKQGKDKEDVK